MRPGLRVSAGWRGGWRPGVALALLCALGGGYAWWALTATVGFRECARDPAAHDGTALVFPLWTVTRVDGPARYEISKVIRDVPVVGDAAGLTVGATVSVMGEFRASDRAVHATRRELHALRKYKEALGVIGFVLVAIAAPLCFRVEGRCVVERWRT